MSAYTSRRVGVRQWRVLLAADTEYPGVIKAYDAGQAIGNGLPFSAHKPVIESLLHLGLLEHVDGDVSADLRSHCTLKITDRGAMARLDRKASHAQGKR